MEKCLAYAVVEGFPDSWIPCTEMVVDLGLCKQHFLALAGIVIGTVAKGESKNGGLEKMLARIADARKRG